MARITTGDCERVVPNRFELVLLGAHRTRELNRGAQPVVETGRDAVTVTALREIASGHLPIDRLRTACATTLAELVGYRRPVIMEEGERPPQASSVETSRDGLEEAPNGQAPDQSSPEPLRSDAQADPALPPTAAPKAACRRQPSASPLWPVQKPDAPGYRSSLGTGLLERQAAA